MTLSTADSNMKVNPPSSVAAPLSNVSSPASGPSANIDMNASLMTGAETASAASTEERFSRFEL